MTSPELDPEYPTPDVALTCDVERIAPYGDKLLVRIDRDERQSAGGIWLGVADIERDRYLRGTVLRAGPGAYGTTRRTRHTRRPVAYRPGDRVLVPRGACHAQLVGPGEREQETLMVSEDQLVACLLEDE